MPFFKKYHELPSSDEALPGRDDPMVIGGVHAVSGSSMLPPFAEDFESVLFGMGCFWGAERRFWTQEGVQVTAVGYSAGITVNPTYEEVCSGLTGHNEVVLVVYDPKYTSLSNLLTLFWESHNPTQGMRQGNDQGTQYRSGIYTFSDEHQQEAINSREHYQQRLLVQGLGEITTEIKRADTFYYAEEYHQQYLHKNPLGYCGLGGLGVCYQS